MNYNNVILITDLFPYQSTEVGFLREEIKHLASAHNVTIVTKDPSPKVNPISLPSNVSLIAYEPTKDYNPLFLLLQCLTFSCLYSELRHIHFNRFFFINVFEALKKLMRSIHLSRFLRSVRSNIEGPVCFYTYWNDYSTHACLLSRQQGDRIISRCHGHDLYRFQPNICPYKDFINPQIDLLVPIAYIGEQYYRNNYNATSVHLQTHHLGVPPASPLAAFDNSTSIRLLTLSRLHYIKRIPMLMQTLASLPSTITVEWTHIGGTPEQTQSALEMAQSVLTPHNNIHFDFKGELSNNDVMAFLQATPFDFIINTSSSEGIPVSLMESMSLGIPAIGTNVGGIPEIITDHYNGYLIPVDFTSSHLEEVFTHYLNMSIEEKLALRHNAYQKWQSDFNADVNFHNFVANAI